VDAAGTSFDDRYTLHGKLGDGLTACVYLARDRKTGQCFACKLAERRGRSATTWSRLADVMRHESQLLQQVGHHPNLVKQQGYFENASESIIMLDVVNGGDCQQLLQRHGALPESTVQNMMMQLHGALSHLHASGVLHRDVKLENVLCDTASRLPTVVLCDLGHAAFADAVHTDRKFYGTPGYAAPEVANGARWTPAADVWAMGVVMYACLSNTLPFDDGRVGWLPDLGSRLWWRVSLEAKLILQALLEPNLDTRSTLDAFSRSEWYTAAAHVRTAAALSPPLGRHAYSMTDMSEILPALPHTSSYTGLESLTQRCARGATAASWPAGAAPGGVGGGQQSDACEETGSSKQASIAAIEVNAERAGDAMCVDVLPTLTQQQAMSPQPMTPQPMTPQPMTPQLMGMKAGVLPGGGMPLPRNVFSCTSLEQLAREAERGSTDTLLASAHAATVKRPAQPGAHVHGHTAPAPARGGSLGRACGDELSQGLLEQQQRLARMRASMRAVKAQGSMPSPHS